MEEKERAYVEKAKELPAGYMAYCVYFPSGFDQDFEKNLINTLAKWGENYGSNLFVATWDIGDPSYIQISKDINLDKLPCLVITDENKPNVNSFLIKISDIRIINNIDLLKQILPNLLQLIFIKDNNEAIKKYLREKNKAMINEIVKNVMKHLNIKFKLSLSLGLFSINVESS
jgi:hypothetical protein